MAKEKCPPGKMLKGGKCVAKPKWLKKAIKESMDVEKPIGKLPPGAKLGDPSTFGPGFHRVEKPKLPKWKRSGKQPPMQAIPMSKRKKKKK